MQLSWHRTRRSTNRHGSSRGQKCNPDELGVPQLLVLFLGNEQFPLGCIFLPKGMNKGRLNPDDWDGAALHVQPIPVNVQPIPVTRTPRGRLAPARQWPPETRGAGWQTAFFGALFVAFGFWRKKRIMHHDKNTSINQAPSSALNSLGKRERQPLQPHLCVPQNLELRAAGVAVLWAGIDAAPDMPIY
jgi:hypothetical protein